MWDVKSFLLGFGVTVAGFFLAYFAGVLVRRLEKKQLPAFKQIQYCPNCLCHTQHLILASGHERDSSCDYGCCLKCQWYYVGAGDHQPPLQVK